MQLISKKKRLLRRAVSAKGDLLRLKIKDFGYDNPNKQINAIIQNQNHNLTLNRHQHIWPYFSSFHYICILLNKLVDIFFNFHNRINTYAGFASVMHTFFWYFTTPKIRINFIIKYFYLSLHVFLMINRITMKLYEFNFLFFFQISLYFTNMLSSSTMKGIVLPPLSKYFMYLLIWVKIILKCLVIIFVANKIFKACINMLKIVKY